ncbi:MAG: Pectate lyase superfamily protein [Candidatus Acidoferrum typicum]|nr:Pectate lyase superfamily protein [Candidatus Acidoferrum typicum]
MKNLLLARTSLFWLIRTLLLSSLALRLLLGSLAPAQTVAPYSYWINVLETGAKGDGVADDSPAILRAVRRAIERGRNGGNVVYFPPSHCYNIASPLELPDPPVRVMLFFDSCLTLNATVTIHGMYNLHGNSSGPKMAFSTDNLADLDVGYKVAPAIRIQGAGTRLENLRIGYMHGSADGIVIDHSARVTLKNVWVQMDQHNKAGIPLKITGGFGYEIDDGGYSSAWDATSPSIQINEDPVACNWTGIVRLRHAFLSAHGIVINERCGGVNSLTFEDILYESARDPFVTIFALGGSGVWGLDLRGVNFADSQSPAPPMIYVHSPLHRVRSISVVNSVTDGSKMLDGDPVSGVNVW